MSWLEAILVTVWLLLAALMAGLRWAALARRRGSGGGARLGLRVRIDSLWRSGL